MLDITAPQAVQVSVREDGKVLWINTEEGCVLRICQISALHIDIPSRVRNKEVNDAS